MNNIELVSQCHEAKISVEPKAELGQEGKTFYFVCSKCKKACNAKTKEDAKSPAMHI